MHEGKVYVVKTESNSFALELLKGVEPNYGRLVWEVALSINGRDVTSNYFRWGNYVHYDLERYNPISPDQKYFFIPDESQSFVILTSSSRRIQLPRGESGQFIGNSYYGNYLLCAYTQEVVLINLTNSLTNQIRLFNDLYDYSLYISKSYFENGQLIIEGMIQGDVVRYRYNFESLTVELI